MGTTSIEMKTEIFTDEMFNLGSRLDTDWYKVFPIVRPDDRINPIVIKKLMHATRDNRPLYWIDGWNLPSMDAAEVEKEVIKDIIECLVWENIK